MRGKWHGAKSKGQRAKGIEHGAEGMEHGEYENAFLS